ncbi:hypothetical protein EDD85DRAFT_187069 [Armillaria nabsnona]|nr:hypothetical protein EDD85DRAFT_187069 [Armillaria nabsnona]
MHRHASDQGVPTQLTYGWPFLTLNLARPLLPRLLTYSCSHWWLFPVHVDSDSDFIFPHVIFQSRTLLHYPSFHFATILWTRPLRGELIEGSSKLSSIRLQYSSIPPSSTTTVGYQHTSSGAVRRIKYPMEYGIAHNGIAIGEPIDLWQRWTKPVLPTAYNLF